MFLIGSILAISSGILYAVRNILVKKMSGRSISPLELNLIYSLVGLIVISGVIFLGGIDLRPVVSNLWFLILALVMGIIAFVAGSHQNSIFTEMEYSFAAPFYSAMPIVETILAFVILREGVTIHGVIGILIITLGAFVIHATPRRLEWKSFLLMFPIIVNLLMFSLLSVIQKKLVLVANPISVIWIMYLVIVVLGLPKIIHLRNKVSSIFLLRGYLWAYVSCAVLALFFGMTAFNYLPIGMVSAMKNATMPVVVLFGSLVLGEGDLRSRVVGSGVIASGAIVMGMR